MFTHLKSFSSRLLLVIAVLLITFVGAPRQVMAYSQLDETHSSSPAAITVTGTVKFEGGDNHAGIKVEMWRNGLYDQTIGVTTTDSLGNYTFSNVDPNYSYSIGAAATIEGYTGDSVWVPMEELIGAVEPVLAPEMMLLRPKQYNIDWVYQPDGSTSFVSGSPTSGSVTLISGTNQWLSLGVISYEDQYSGFCFSTGSYTVLTSSFCQDFYVYNDRSTPASLLANNGLGGVHDMGAVPLESVTTAPDKSNGVGFGLFYSSTATSAVVGHTYTVVTADGNHYAKFFVKSILYVTPPTTTLEINFHNGQPGSFFTLTGDYFPPNSQAAIIVNGVTLGTVSTDNFGHFVFLLDTTQAGMGRYSVTARVNPSASTWFVLDADDPIRPKEGDSTVLSVPDGIAYTRFVFLPAIQR